jgi:hypothetical protein
MLLTVLSKPGDAARLTQIIFRRRVPPAPAGRTTRCAGTKVDHRGNALGGRAIEGRQHERHRHQLCARV